MSKKFKVVLNPEVYDEEMIELYADDPETITLSSIMSHVPGTVKQFPLEIETKGCDCCARFYLISKEEYVKLLEHLKEKIEKELNQFKTNQT